MGPSKPPEKNDEGKPNVVLRRMGMSLSVLGAVVFSAGLAACRQNSGGIPDARCILMLASGITMLVSGFYIWHIAKQTD